LQRLLWTSILQPLSSKTQLEAITNRLDFVELLIGNGDAFFELSEKLERCPDLEFLVATCLVQIPKFGTQCGSAEKCQTLITKILGLKKAVCKVEEMHSALARLEDKSGNCLLLQLFREALKNPLIDEMRSKIDMVLDDTAGTSGNGVRFLFRFVASCLSIRLFCARQPWQAAQIQRCFAVKPGRDALLDVARATFNDNFDDINQLVAQYREEFGIGCANYALRDLVPFPSPKGVLL
jgi:DNA mismatch repair ATPase MutS